MDDLPERAARGVAATLGLRPPVDVWTLAEQHFGARILVRPSRGDGRLVHDKRSMEIHLCPYTTPTRRRFTIAHELGHLWALREGLANGALSRVEEEQFCNAFAAALLIPRDWLDTFGREQPESLGSLCRLARLTQTSISAMLIRLRAKIGWRGTLLRCHMEEQSWRVCSVVGASASLRSQLSLTPDAIPIFARAGTHSLFTSVRLPLHIGGRSFHCRAEISVGNRSAIALTRLHGQMRPQPLNSDLLAVRIWLLTRTNDSGFLAQSHCQSTGW